MGPALAVIGPPAVGAVVFALVNAGVSEVQYEAHKAVESKEVAARQKAEDEYRNAKDAYEKQRQAQLDWLNEQTRMETHAEVEYKEADEAMEAYYEATGGDREKMAAIPVVMPEPSYGDFYTPSDMAKKSSL
jgi:homoserine dehydrogenase